MMGTKIRSFSPLPHDLSLEDLVPEDHLYRRLEATLDLSFVRELVAPLYAKSGRPSGDPVVFFKLQLVMFFQNLRSERQLMGVVADRLSLRWYLGYDLFEPLPDHSSLTRIRERYGLSVFRCFFERIVQEGIDAGLMWGKELFFDATKVEANASIDSTRSRSLVEGRLEEHLAETFPDEVPSDPDEGRPGAVIVGAVGAGGEDGRALARKNALGHRWIAEAGRLQRSVARWGYTRMADLRVSTTDPDASPMHQKNKSGSRLGYLTHYVVDGGKARVVLNVLVTAAEVTENLPMREMLFRSTFRWRLRPRSHRRRRLRHEGERGVHREGGRPGLPRAARARETHLFVHHRGLRLRRREGPLHLPPRRDVAPSGPRSQGRIRKVRREDDRLRGVPPEEQVHEQPEGTLDQSQPRRGVPRKGQSVPRNRSVPQGAAQT